MRQLGEQVCFARAPDVCVEVMSPSNTKAEIQEKIALYFDAGARGVWLCAQSGAMSFFSPGATRSMRASKMCPQFPKRVELP